MMLCLPLYIRQKMLMKQHVDVSVQKEEAPKDQVLDYIEKLNAKINKITKKAELATTARRNGVSHVDWKSASYYSFGKYTQEAR